MKTSWDILKSAITNDLLSQEIKNPQIHICALGRIEDLLREYFEEYFIEPDSILEIEKKLFKSMLAQHKYSEELSDAESIIVNNIYDYLQSNSDIPQSSEESQSFSSSDEMHPSIQENRTNAILRQKFKLDIYEKELSILRNLFRHSEVDSKYIRLKEIYSVAECFWELQLSNLPEEGVKYLFIAEAPPWSTQLVNYVYNPESESRTLLKALKKAFFGKYTSSTEGNTDILRDLTGKGLIVIDSIPFAMKYTSKRKNSQYQELVNLTAHSYLLKKINRKDLKWSPELKIAFGFLYNARAVMKALNGKIFIEQLNKEFSLTEDIICAGGNNYPNGEKLKNIYNI